MADNSEQLNRLAYQETMETTVPEEEFGPDALTRRAKLAMATVTTDNDMKERTVRTMI